MYNSVYCTRLCTLKPYFESLLTTVWQQSSNNGFWQNATIKILIYGMEGPYLQDKAIILTILYSKQSSGGVVNIQLTL